MKEWSQREYIEWLITLTGILKAFISQNAWISKRIIRGNGKNSENAFTEGTINKSHHQKWVPPKSPWMQMGWKDNKMNVNKEWLVNSPTGLKNKDENQKVTNRPVFSFTFSRDEQYKSQSWQTDEYQNINIDQQTNISSR